MPNSVLRKSQEECLVELPLVPGNCGGSRSDPAGLISRQNGPQFESFKLSMEGDDSNLFFPMYNGGGKARVRSTRVGGEQTQCVDLYGTSCRLSPSFAVYYVRDSGVYQGRWLMRCVSVVDAGGRWAVQMGVE